MTMSGENPAVNSGDPELDRLVRDWLRWNPEGSGDSDAVSQLLRGNEWDQLRKMMKSRKTFGTAGIRGVMGPG